jgi:hypothetical protein
MSAIGVIVLGVWFVCMYRDKVLYYVLGGMPSLIVYVAYHKICFGSFLRPATSFNNPQFISAEGVGGMFAASTMLESLGGLLVSPYRGLYWYMPFLLCALLVIPYWKRVKQKDLVIVGASAASLTLLLNMIFNGWHGGNSTGPRYQIVALGWHAVIIACVLARKSTGQSTVRTAVNWMCVGLLTVSIANMVVITTVSPMAAEVKQNLDPREVAIRKNPLPFMYRVFFKGFQQLSTPGFYSSPIPIQVFHVGDAHRSTGQYAGYPPDSIHHRRHSDCDAVAEARIGRWRRSREARKRLRERP